MEEPRRVEYANDNHLISLSLSKDNDVCQIHEGHPDEDDIVSFYSYRERPKTCRERVGECLVSVTCTGIVGLVLSLCVVIAAIGLAKIIAAGMFWGLCPLSPSLPTYLLVSGLMPGLFYVTCRTRRKYKGAVPGKQRIVARWEFSVLHYTFDTEKSWQAGLAAVLSVFLMIWLCYETEALVQLQPASVIQDSTDPCQQVVFLSDALSVLQAYENDKLPPPTNAVQQVGRSRRAVLQWIPVHCGIPGNESR